MFNRRKKIIVRDNAIARSGPSVQHSPSNHEVQNNQHNVQGQDFEENEPYPNDVNPNNIQDNEDPEEENLDENVSYGNDPNPNEMQEDEEDPEMPEQQENLDENVTNGNDLNPNEMQEDEEDPEMPEQQENLDEDSKLTILECLKQWAIQRNIRDELKKLQTLQVLLSLLSKNGHIKPISAKTLLCTPGVMDGIGEKLSGMEVVKYDPETQIRKLYKDCISTHESVESLNLQLSTDGLPIGGEAVWPFMVTLFPKNLTDLLLPLAIAVGPSKPSDNKWLESSILKLKEIEETGIQVEDRRINVRVHSLVCDLPARNDLLNSMHHSGYSSCNRCKIKGIYEDGFPRLVHHLEAPAEPRTDEEFRALNSVETVPLMHLGLDMSISLDIMHLLYLGIFRATILTSWFSAKRQEECFVSVEKRRLLTEREREINSGLPREFQRKLSNVIKPSRLKATQSRLIFLYLVYPFFRSIIPENFLQHLRLLTVPCAIMVGELHTEIGVTIDWINSTLRRFIEEGGGLYGAKFYTPNMHSLLHLTDDYQHFNDLQSADAFRLENHNQESP